MDPGEGQLARGAALLVRQHHHILHQLPVLQAQAQQGTQRQVISLQPCWRTKVWASFKPRRAASLWRLERDDSHDFRVYGFGLKP